MGSFLARVPCISPFHANNLNPLLPREGIAKKKLPHADLILPWPWNQVERVDFRILGFGVRGRELRQRESWVSMREREKE